MTATPATLDDIAGAVCSRIVRDWDAAILCRTLGWLSATQPEEFLRAVEAAELHRDAPGLAQEWAGFHERSGK
jgi:hypothetical protein